MNKATLRLLASVSCSLLVVMTVALTGAEARAQCPLTELTSGLRRPVGVTQSNQGHLLVSETGTSLPNTGRISIVDQSGNRRTLLDGLPSGISDVGDPSGPDGLFLRGRTLYVAIGSGDAGRAGPVPGTTVPNPNPLSSPLFSSILAIHFSAGVEKGTGGFTLSLADQQALASGQTVTLSNGGGEGLAKGSDKITVELVVDFPNFISLPLPFFTSNVQLSNPFDLVAVGDQLYVTDGGRNRVWQVDMPTGAFSTLAIFPPVPNPLFPVLGPPSSDAVPTGIAYSGDQLLVTLFRGVPFAPSASVVEWVDPLTGDHAPLIGGRKTAIAVLPVTTAGETNYLVLQHASIGPFFGGPGLLLRFATAGAAPTVIADCLSRPTSMTLDERTGTLYATELGGRIVAIPVASN